MSREEYEERMLEHLRAIKELSLDYYPDVQQINMALINEGESRFYYDVFTVNHKINLNSFNGECINYI